MEFTVFQKHVMGWARMAKVFYKKMWESMHKFGYVTHDQPLDMIHIAEDFPNEDVKKIALLHEIGHIYYNHTSFGLKEEISSIRDAFNDVGVPFEKILHYGGPHAFLNICLDLEVNSKILTLSNIKTMDAYFSICTPDKYGVTYQKTFRDYYKPMARRLKSCEDINRSSFDATSCISSMTGYGSNAKSYGPDLSDLIDYATPSDYIDDPEMKDVLTKESWIQTTCNHSDGDIKTVDEVLKSMGIKSIGANHATIGSYDCNGDPNEQIKKFLNKIIETSMDYQPDSLKHYNRGTRKNDGGFLYTSLRRKAQTRKKKIMFICDVSGSMSISSIVSALSSLKSTISLISPEARLLTWDTDKVEEFPIDRLPKQFKSGGGTDMAKAIDYAIAHGYKDIVLYSDLDTDEYSLNKAVEHVDSIYTIYVNDAYFDGIRPGLKSFLKKNNDVLYLK